MEHEGRDIKKHWDRVYEKSETDSLGWYEDYPAPLLNKMVKPGGFAIIAAFNLQGAEK